MKKMPVQIEDLLTMKCPSDLMYSPDGKTIALNVTVPDEKNNAYMQSVWTIENGMEKQLTSSLSAKAECWIDDETLLIRRRDPDTSGGTSFYTLPVHGGEAMPYFHVPVSVGKILPVGDECYAMSAGIRMKDPDAYRDDEEAAKKKAEQQEKEKDYQVVDELPYWANGRGFTNGSRNALFVYDNGQLKRISGPDTDTGSFVLYENRIIYTAEKWQGKRKNRQKIYAYDLNTGKTVCIFKKTSYSISSLLVIAGKLYAFMSDHQVYGTNQTPYLYLISDGKEELCFCPERSLRSSCGSDIAYGGGRDKKASGNGFVSLATEEDHVQIRRYDETWGYELLFDKQGSVRDFDIYEDKTVFLYSSWDRPFEVYERDGKGNVTRLSHLNDGYVESHVILEPKRIDFEACGDSLHGWAIFPDHYNAKKKYPCVLDIHGGPKVIYGVNFFHEMQVWAARGYIVLFANIRGSDGRGDAFADVRDAYGTVDYEEIIAFADAAVQQIPAIDEKRMCVTGGSYGGYMTNWIIGHTDRFCCAASQRSMTNIISKVFISDIGTTYDAEEAGAKNVFDGFDRMWEHSPLKYAGNAKTPTLFIHSDEDYRCPLSEGMQMMQALAYNNVETRMVIFKGENHELSRGGKPLHRLRRLKEITDWFDRHTGNRKESGK